MSKFWQAFSKSQKKIAGFHAVWYVVLVNFLCIRWKEKGSFLHNLSENCFLLEYFVPQFWSKKWQPKMVGKGAVKHCLNRCLSRDLIAVSCTAMYNERKDRYEWEKVMFPLVPFQQRRAFSGGVGAWNETVERPEQRGGALRYVQSFRRVVRGWCERRGEKRRTKRNL